MITHLETFRLKRSRQVGRRPAQHGRRRAGGRPVMPEDAALYVCGCGSAFTAAVTASVTYPACGDG